MHNQETRTIAGQQLTLLAGVRYRASRPFSQRGRTVYPVSIERLDDPVGDVLVVGGLSYQDADKLVNEFNNGPMSFDGRIW